MSLLKYIPVVLWSFLGIRRRAGADDEMNKIKPAMLIGVGLGVAGVFGIGVWGLANLAMLTLSH